MGFGRWHGLVIRATPKRRLLGGVDHHPQTTPRFVWGWHAYLLIFLWHPSSRTGRTLPGFALGHSLYRRGDEVADLCGGEAHLSGGLGFHLGRDGQDRAFDHLAGPD